ncbi:MAG TPA: ATP-binding protein [Sphingobium sp.]|uniref:HAMP domain-containing sensor histidine kinase n=1 Tax=Sphingobium sp. TaxID=1912891 RepID=UPI002ED212C3
MPERRRTTRALLAAFVAFYVIATILLGVAAYFLSDSALSRQLDDRVRAEIRVMQHIHQENGLADVQEALHRRENQGFNLLGYLLLDPHHVRKGGTLPMINPAPGWSHEAFADMDGRINRMRALTVALSDGSRLTVAAETDPLDALRHMMILLFTTGVLVMLAGGLGAAYLFARQLDQRLAVVTDTALAITGGDLAQRIAVGPHEDEFDRLAMTLNRMLDRNAQLIANLRQVSGDLAHDLRTPIAHLRQRLERALEDAPKGSKLRGEVAGAIEQSDAILSLFAALLRISEVEARTLRRYFQPMDLSATARHICDSYGPAAEDSGRSFDYSIEEGVELIGDSELLAQALVNLIENALRHTPVGTHIAVSLRRTGDHLHLRVADDGAGVAEAQLPELAKRFTRLDKSRAAPGFGLGLNLVDAIISMHDGRLTFRNLNPGFEALITLVAGSEINANPVK